MTGFGDHIILNGQKIAPDEIRKIALDKIHIPSIHEWEKELYQFLLDWFTERSYMDVQTSGSTGLPKIIQLPKEVMIASAQRTIDYFGLKKNEPILLSLSCKYIAGKMMVVRAILGEMDLVTYDPAGSFDFLIDRTFALGAMAPNQVHKILESERGIQKLEGIQNLLIGGSSIPHELEDRLSTLSNRIVSTYGMTETASHIAIRPLSGIEKSNVYSCLEGTTVSVDSENRLCIHVPGQDDMQTNDLAILYSPTSFQIVGRYDHAIISGGIKYFPEIIERKLESNFRQRYIISSVSDSKLGQKIVLVVEGEPFETKHLMSRIEHLLAAYECPKEIHFLPKFPETENGKVLRNAIKSLIQKV